MSNFINKTLILHPLTQGFGADGGKVSGILKGEKSARKTAISLIAINFAPTDEGSYSLIVSDKDENMQVFDLNNPPCRENRDLPQPFDMENGFAALIIYSKKDDIKAVAFGTLLDNIIKISEFTKYYADFKKTEIAKAQNKQIIENNYDRGRRGDGEDDDSCDEERDGGDNGNSDRKIAADEHCNGESESDREITADRQYNGTDYPAERQAGFSADKVTINAKVTNNSEIATAKTDKEYILKSEVKEIQATEQAEQQEKTKAVAEDETIYDDEAVATENYYENNDDFNLGENINLDDYIKADEEVSEIESEIENITCEKVIENKSSEKEVEDEYISVENNDIEKSCDNCQQEKETTCDKNSDDERNCFCEGEKPAFYQSVEDKLYDIFEKYPPDKELSQVIPDSNWARIPLDNNKFYVVGIIYEHGEIAYIVYGVPGKVDYKPKGFERYSVFLPESLYNDYQSGYWCMFQSAIDGSLKQ